MEFYTLAKDNWIVILQNLLPSGAHIYKNSLQRNKYEWFVKCALELGIKYKEQWILKI